MVNLSTDDRQPLIFLLQRLPEMATEESRRQLLIFSGLEQLVSNINLSGASFIAANLIVNYLSNYGRLTFDHESLGLFLNSIKSLVGKEQQGFLNTLLLKYNMMLPIAPLADLEEWRGTETASQVFEKIIGENTLRPIAFLAQGLQVARSVAYVGINTGTQRWSGTGFLIAVNLLLTNHHVVPSTECLPNAIFRFNYEENHRGEAQESREYRTRKNGIFHTCEELDYTVIQLEDEPGCEWGWLHLRPITTRRNDRVNIIQHPNGQPKQISFQNNFVEYVNDNVVQYVTSTQNGSSGSPVLSDGWEVVALHHAGGNIREPTTERRYFRNEGILVTSILANLPLLIKDLVSGA